MGDSPKVIHEDDVQVHEIDHGRFGGKRRLLGMATGAAQLGCSLWELAPDRKSPPYHWHAANEEALYVLGGEGTLRLDGKEYPLRKGTYAALVVGPAGAHQVINTSSAPLRYLCFSTLKEPEVAVYPDSDKLGVMMGYTGTLPRILRMVPASAQAGYYDGEE